VRSRSRQRGAGSHAFLLITIIEASLMQIKVRSVSPSYGVWLSQG
jgi:hypothetical protein